MRLSVLCFALIFCAAHLPPCMAAPPEVPAKLSAKVGSPVAFDVKTDAGKPFSFAPGFDKAKCPVFRLYSEDSAVASFLVFPSEAGEFYFTFWTRGDKEAGYSQLVLTATATGAPVPKDPPKKPVDPIIPPPTGNLYFLVVRPDGPASPDFTRVMLLAEWDTLAKAGHAFKDKTATDAAKLGVKIPANLSLPVVVVLRPKPDGKASEQLAVVPLPTTGQGVKDLPSVVK